MDRVTRVQILDESVFILNNANTLGKSTNRIVLLRAMSKIGQAGLLSLGEATGLSKGKLN